MIIKFSKPEAEAVLHRLECFDCIAEVFADTEGLTHLADGAALRASELSSNLSTFHQIEVDEKSQLDVELLSEAIDGSTYVAATRSFCPVDVNRDRAVRMAERTLQAAAHKIEAALGFDRGHLTVPA